MVFSRIRLRDAVVQPKRLSASVPNSLFTLAIASLSGSGGAVHKLGVRSGPSAWNGSGGHRAVRPTLKLVDTRAADGVVKAWSLKWFLRRRRQGLIPRAWVYGRPDCSSTLVPLGHRSLRRATLGARAEVRPRGIDRPGVLGSLPALARVLIVSANCSVGIAGIVRWSWPRFHAQIPRGRAEIIRPCGVPVGRLR